MAYRVITTADIIRSLNKTPQTIHQICKNLNLGETNARSTLLTLIDVGYVRKERSNLAIQKKQLLLFENLASKPVNGNK